MKAKKLLILTLTFSVLGVSAVVASSPLGDFKGFPIAKVSVNNSEVATGSVPAFIVDGQTVVPLGVVSRSLQAFLRWNPAANEAVIYKPNVHMFVGKEVTKDGSVKQSFGKVPQGDTVKFVVFAQVDNLRTGIHSFKIEIADPSGTLVAESEETQLEKYSESFWYPWPFEVKFDAYGKYKVKFLMKPSADSDYVVVSEKIINAE